MLWFDSDMGVSSMDNPHFRRGRAALDSGSFTMAHAAFDRACADAPNDPVLEAYRAFAKYLSVKSQDGVGGTDNEPWLARVAKQNCRRIIEAATARAEGFDAGHVFMARMLIDEGSFPEARQHLDRALRLDPNNAETRRLSAELDARGPARKPGVRARIADWFSAVRPT